MLITEKLINVLAPHTCIGCGLEGSILCNWCRGEAIFPLPPRCYRCKALSSDYRVCPKCRSISQLRHVWVSTEYSGIVKDLVRAFKFERAQAATVVIANLMTEVLPFMASDTLLLPIPTATSRLRQRGYDHALLLAKAISRKTGLPYQTALARLGQSRQVGAKRDIRLKQLGDSFIVKDARGIYGREIVLVDDIVTTGGTLEAAARILKHVGAKSVSAIVFAQKS